MKWKLGALSLFVLLASPAVARAQENAVAGTIVVDKPQEAPPDG